MSTKSIGTEWVKPPTPDQIELTLFGPGFGEAIIVHLGSNRWLLVDSCTDSATGTPAALDYLKALGVDPTDGVVLVITTHWHDDHIRGLSRVLDSCPGAIFTCSAAFREKEFFAMVEAHARQPPIATGTGVAEIDRTFKILATRHQVVRRATASRRLLTYSAGDSAHGQSIEIFSLSPSDQEIHLAHLALAGMVNQETKRRAISRNPNHNSVVLWISIGDTCLLLGADLEETSEPGTGWTAILNDSTRPEGQASALKVPHHGSNNAYNGGVWSEMLLAQPYAILTPWTLGKGSLPTPEGINTILAHTPHGYITSPPRAPKSGQGLPQAVKAELRDRKLKLLKAEPTTGAVRLRNGGVLAPSSWTISVKEPGCTLASLTSAAKSA